MTEVAGLRGRTEICLADRPGWRRLADGAATLWWSGCLYAPDALTLCRRFAALAPSDDQVRQWLGSLDGHFALVAERPDLVVAAVDRVRSIPLFYAAKDGRVRIDNAAPRLVAAAGLDAVNDIGALSLAMAGYTIGNDTLYRGLNQLGPGEYLLIRGAESCCGRYHRYEPWRVEDGDHAALITEASEVTLGILEKVAASAGGRQIVVPLSAGLDSRLIASGLVHIGYRNIRCFAYGLAGNYEARASRRVAERLGVPWRFHPYGAAEQARFFRGTLHRSYLRFADSCCAVPFVQDLGAVDALERAGFIADDAILINGNSGDFISGMHIAEPLRRARSELSAADRLKLILDATIAKHFRLWDALGTDANDAAIRERLLRQLADAGLEPGAPEADHGLYEYLEFTNRQAKYVITGQRIYEFLGHDWRLPLWDNAYLDFWQKVPLALKAGQRLYREMLERDNWGGVWGPGWRFRHRVSPAWMRLVVRPALKTLSAPLGRRRWHRFERRVLGYWTDLWAAQAIVPYRTALRDRRGARHFVSWHAEAYLREKGLGYDGRPRA